MATTNTSTPSSQTPNTYKRTTSALDIFPGSRIKLSANPISVLLLLIYSPVGLFLVVSRISMLLVFLLFSLVFNYVLKGPYFWTKFLQKIQLFFMGIYVHIDDKIYQNLQNNEKMNSNNLNHIYLANFNSYADTFILPIYLAPYYNGAEESQTSNTQILNKVLYRTNKVKNSLHFPENCPSSGNAILKWQNLKFLTKLEENCNIYPVYSKTKLMFLPLETSTIYSTVFSDIITVFFCPFTIYKVNSTDPAVFQIKSNNPIQTETRHTSLTETSSNIVLNSFAYKIRMAQANAGNITTTSVSIADKNELLKRYLMEETQEELGINIYSSTRNNRQNATTTHTNSASKNTSTLALNKSDVGSATFIETKQDKLVIEQIAYIFNKLFCRKEVADVYYKEKSNYECTIKGLLKLKEKESNLDSLLSWDRNPVNVSMSLEERKSSLYNFAKARYICKYKEI